VGQARLAAEIEVRPPTGLAYDLQRRPALEIEETVLSEVNRGGDSPPKRDNSASFEV
jgi:hypothetical protein